MKISYLCKNNAYTAARQQRRFVKSKRYIMITLSIDKATCIRCGKCVRVCPASIFTQATPKEEIGVQYVENCIVCGHCCAVCPTSSVIHSGFPPEKVHPVDSTLLPTPEQIMLLCKSRRSNRAFSTKPIPAALLDQVLEAAHRAPTARNLQEVAFTLVTDPAVLKQVIDLTMDTFLSLKKWLGNAFVKTALKPFMPETYRMLPAFGRMQQAWLEGDDPILRKATALILIHTPKAERFGCQDANLAYQNGSLMAETLGLNHFYTGFVCSAVGLDKKGRIAHLLNIDGDIHAGMALGMPAFRYPNYIDRQKIKVRKYINK